MLTREEKNARRRQRFLERYTTDPDYRKGRIIAAIQSARRRKPWLKWTPEQKENRNRKARERRAADPLVRERQKIAYLTRTPEQKARYLAARRLKVLGCTPTRANPGACECCGRLSKAMNVDHCHRTGVFRGWLCNTCNRAAGMLGDTINGAKNLVAYYERFGLDLL